MASQGDGRPPKHSVFRHDIFFDPDILVMASMVMANLDTAEREHLCSLDRCFRLCRRVQVGLQAGRERGRCRAPDRDEGRRELRDQPVHFDYGLYGYDLYSYGRYIVLGLAIRASGASRSARAFCSLPRGFGKLSTVPF